MGAQVVRMEESRDLRGKFTKVGEVEHCFRFALII
jgi:hypothetical protein